MWRADRPDHVTAETGSPLGEWGLFRTRVSNRHAHPERRTMNPKKEALKPEELYVLLDREFRRRRPRECGTCYVQLPYRVDANRSTAGNWEVLLPPGCGN